MNDHIHQDVKRLVHEEVRHLSGDQNDLTKMPDEVSRARGGPLVSSKGYKKGPHLYILALAFTRVWARYPQEKLLAAYVKLGYYDIVKVPRIFAVSEAYTRKGSFLKLQRLVESRRAL